MPMEIFIKETGSMIKPKAKELTHMLTELTTRVIGRTINSMDTEPNPGLMVLNTKVNMLTVRSKVMANLPSQTVATMKESSTLTKFLEKATTSGLMAKLISDNGKRIRWTVAVNSPGKTAKFTKVNSSTTKEKARELSRGLMAADMKVAGRQENNTVRVSTIVKIINLEEVSGIMVKNSAGKMKLEVPLPNKNL